MRPTALNRMARGYIVCLASISVGLAVTETVFGQATLEELIATAIQQERAGQLDEAAASRSKAAATVKTDAERATHWLELAEMWQRAERSDGEADALRMAFRFLAPYDPRHWPLTERYLLLCRDVLDRPGWAVEHLESLICGLDPGRGDYRVWKELAITRHFLGDTDWARSVYRVLKRTTQEDAGARYRRESLSYLLDRCTTYSPGQPGFSRNLETAAILGRFRTRLNEKKWKEASDLIVELLTRHHDALMEWPSVEGVAPRVVVSQLLTSMSPQAREAYDAHCRVEMEAVIRRGHSEELQRFAYTHPWPAFEWDLSISMANALFAEQHFARSRAWYLKASERTEDPSRHSQALAKAIRASILAGESPVAVPSDGQVILKGEAVGLRSATKEWIEDLAVQPSEPPTVTPLNRMTHDRLRLQEAPLALKKWQAGWQHGYDKPNPRMTEAFVPYQLSGDRHQVFLNTSEMVYAIDPEEERLLWARGPSDLFTAELTPPSIENINPVRTPKCFYVATSPDAVFFRLNWATRLRNEPRSVISAARRTDGALIWSSASNPPLADLQFISDPVYADGVVVAAAWAPREIPVFYLVGLDAVDGQLLWRTSLFTGTMFPAFREGGLMDTPLGSAPPTINNGRVYFSAGMGVLACVDLDQGYVRWLQRYPRISEYGPDEWAGRYFVNRPSTPILARDNLVLLAAKDCRGILFFDADMGQLLRRYDAIDFRMLFAADEQHAYVQQGTAVAAIRLCDAGTAWKTELATPRCIGTPTLSARGILCNTRYGMQVLSPADGHIVESLHQSGWDAMGNPLDLGDRIVTVSTSAVHVFAEKVNGGEHWTLPRTPHDSPVSLEIKLPGGLARWVLAAPDRGSFFLSEQAPELLVTRSWETFQLRQIEPAPTLLWEVAAPSWPRGIQFDRSVLLLDYRQGMLIAIDIQTGRERWRISSDAMRETGTGSGAFANGNQVIWYHGRTLQVLNAADGKTLWSRPFEPDAVIRGVFPQQNGLGVFVHRSTSAPFAVQLDRSTGNIIHRIPLVQKHAAQKSHTLHCASTGERNTLTVLPIALVDGNRIVLVDFETGHSRVFEHKGPAGGWLLQAGNTLCVGGQQGLVGAYTLPECKPLSVCVAGPWAVADGIEYYCSGPRIFAHDITSGQPVWQTRSFKWTTRHLVVSGETLLAAQVYTSETEPGGRVIAIDRTTGDVTDEIENSGFVFNEMGHQGNRLFTSDHGYLSLFGAPTQPRRVRIDQPHGDPEAILAIRQAADLKQKVLEPPPIAALTPTIDGDLTDWKTAAWTDLGWPENWRPDHVLRSQARARRPTSTGDSAARFALSQDKQCVYIAVEVHDDEHEAVPSRPLWRGDHVELQWRPEPGDISNALTLTGAVVDHVPCLDMGTRRSPQRAMPRTDAWPAWLQAALAEADTPWLRRRAAAGIDLPGLAFAARRDDVRHLTLYEFAIPVSFLPEMTGPSSTILWDIFVGDADGEGLEGGLEPGTASTQMGQPIGYVQWPSK